MTRCQLNAPREAFAGLAVPLACSLDGAPPLTEVPVRFALVAGTAEVELTTVAVLTSSAGSGNGAAQVVLGESAGAVTVVATPIVDGRPGAAGTAVVVLI